MKEQRKRQRKYTGTMQFFHNFEHDSEGLNHCHSAGNYPYTIEHKDGKHIISAKIAEGHGTACKPQWFKFSVRCNGGYDMAFGVRIDGPPAKKSKGLTRRKPIRITPKTPRLSR